MLPWLLVVTSEELLKFHNINLLPFSLSPNHLIYKLKLLEREDFLLTEHPPHMHEPLIHFFIKCLRCAHFYEWMVRET